MTSTTPVIKSFDNSPKSKGSNGVKRGKGKTIEVTPKTPAQPEQWVIEASEPINIMDLGKGESVQAIVEPVTPAQPVVEPVVALEVTPANKKAKNTSKKLFNRLWAIELDKLQLAAMASLLEEAIQLEAHIPSDEAVQPEIKPTQTSTQHTDKNGNVIVLLPFEDAQVTVLNDVIESLDATYIEGVFTLMPALVKFTASKAKHAKTLISEGYLVKEGKGYMVTPKTLTLFGVTMADIEANFKEALASI